MAELNLDASHFAQLKQAKTSITDLKGFLAKAKRAGLEVGGVEKELLEREKQVNQLRDGFFPGQTL